MRRQRNAKIIATLGPTSSNPEIIEALFKAGADLFRLNFSHGSHADHQHRVQVIRDLEKKAYKPIGILMDLQGPKLRIGNFATASIHLRAGQPFRLDLDEQQGDQRRVPLPHPEILSALEPDIDLLLDDGKIRLRVKRCGADFADTEVVIGGPLSNHKGVNVPGVVVPLSAMTDKDHEDLAFGLDLGVDWVALSFVQGPDDVRELRDLVKGRAAVLSKLEKPKAIERLEDIVELSDAVMVARGDLGVELPPERVPTVQKRIIRACRQAGKPVVVATQMLESMINAPTPTRAEASDVATAIYDGADAVMLSGETAAGQYPTEAVSIMNRIIVHVERDSYYRNQIDASRPEPASTTADAVCAALGSITRVMSIAATVTFTSSGFTALRAARERPEAPILGLTPHLSTARRLALVWGVHPMLSVDVEHVHEMVKDALRAARGEGFAERGQAIAITAGMPFGTAGTTNLLRIAWIE